VIAECTRKPTVEVKLRGFTSQRPIVIRCCARVNLILCRLLVRIKLISVNLLKLIKHLDLHVDDVACYVGFGRKSGLAVVFYLKSKGP